MLKDNNFWIPKDVKGGLYIGCYDDMLTIKIGQTLGSIRERVLKIDQEANNHFIIQFYYPFSVSFSNKEENEIFALAMEDLLHDYMTSFCNGKPSIAEKIITNVPLRVAKLSLPHLKKSFLNSCAKRKEVEANLR